MAPEKGPIVDVATTNAPDTAPTAETSPEPKSLPPADGQQTAGLHFGRYFSSPDAHPYDAVEWQRRDATILGEGGNKVFEQKEVEFPAFWSQRAANIVASKYFHGRIDTDEREYSLKQLIGRVVGTITQWGLDGSYFAAGEDAEVFSDELTHLLLHQKAAFNSPVWFNLGVAGERQQASACYINHVDDTMESILDLAKTEGLIFKWGSGAGVNLSRLRGSMEQLSGGGVASGPVSFMKGFDAFAGVIKSGGKTRRAAKMVILDIDHPDIVEFIESKSSEERKAWSLIDSGYDPALDGEAYTSVFFQNANHSVRASDRFMEATEKGEPWQIIGRVDGQPMGSLWARDLLQAIANCTHQCGDPGMQFDDTINQWHTCKETDRIYASNPCSEYMFLDETACNLASLNLLAFLQDDGSFDIESFRRAVDVIFTAMEIIVGGADYPTERITRNSHRLPTPRYRLCQPRCPADASGPAVRLGGRSRLCCRDHRDHDRRSLRPVCPYRGGDGSLCRLPKKPAIHARCHEHAPPSGPCAESGLIASAPGSRRTAGLGSSGGTGTSARLPQQSSVGPGADRDHQLHDGL